MYHQPQCQEVFWVENNDISTITEWIENQGGNVNLQDANNNQLFGVALLHKHWDLANYLLEHGANANAPVFEQAHGKRFPIQIAMEHAQWELVERMIRMGANPKVYVNHISPLFYFCKTKNIGMVNFILTLGIPDIVNYPEHNSPLKMAAILGDRDLVQILVPAGASIESKESQDGNGTSAGCMFTPIQYAAMFGHRHIVSELMNLPQCRSDLVDSNMSSSYESNIDVNEIVNSMLPYNNNGFDYPNDAGGKQNLRIDLLLLQACAKNYILQRAVFRISGTDAQIRQRSNEYLNRALLALDVIDRSTQPPPIVTPSTRGFDRIKSVQKMMFYLFCTSVATYVRNHPGMRNIGVIKDGWRAISYLGRAVSGTVDRGYFHGNRLIRINLEQTLNANWENILRTVGMLRDFITNPDHQSLRVLKSTLLYKISAHQSDCEQLSKLQNMYVCFNETDLQSNDRNRVQAILNAISATLEIITVHLSDFSSPYFHDLNFDALSQVRNHLRHINGDNNNQDVFSNRSRALRFEMLINGQNPKLMAAIIHFVQHDFAEIRKRINAYYTFVESIDVDNLQALQQRFIESTGRTAYARNTLWSYYNFLNYRRSVSSLCALLEVRDNNQNYPQEGVIHRHLRTTTDITNAHDDTNLRRWNARVRTTLGLTRTYIQSFQPSERRKINEEVKKLLPNQTDLQSTTKYSRRIQCYLRYVANIHYAITTLERIIDTNRTIQQHNDRILREVVPESSPSYELLPREEQARNDNLAREIERNTIVRYNAIEWQVAHFYEHVSNLIENQEFLDTYCEENGNTIQLLLDIEQIRNYVAHVANLSFVNEQGLAANQYQLFDLCQHAPSILEGFQKVHLKWQTLLTKLIAIVPQEKVHQITNQQGNPALVSSNSQYYGLTSKQLLGVGGAALTATIGFACYKYLKRS